MLDSNEQLRRLRKRIARIDAKYAREQHRPVPAAFARPKPAWPLCGIEEWSEGSVVANEFGEHFQMERLFPGHKQHGSADLGALIEMPDTLLDALTEREIGTPPTRWAFLDTETTGLLGDSGTFAFLMGVGRITSDGFRVRQFFVREYAEECSALAALEAHLAEFDVLVTYNGKSYDQPLLETRFRIRRREHPFSRLSHVDLLHGARRLWKLRLENCRLIQLEQEILGFCREGDLPGELIPYVYFEYLRSHEARRLVPIFHHNAMDIVTLACLTAIVPAAFQGADSKSLASLGIRRGEELVSIARWLLAAGQHEQALELFGRAVKGRLPDNLSFRTLWDMAVLEKKLLGPDAALEKFKELATCHNEYRLNALEELAKYHEHTTRDLVSALRYTTEALGLGDSSSLNRRRERLQKRLEKKQSRIKVDGITRT